MRTRENILSEVLGLNSEIVELQSKINSLYKEAKAIEDIDDDSDGRHSYLDCIRSYTT